MIQKQSCLFFLFVLLLITVGCNRKGTYTCHVLDLAETFLTSHPDSAYKLLSLLERDTMCRENFSHWCLLYGKLSQRMPLNPLPSFDWRDVTEWYEKHGTLSDRLCARLFLGESYAAEKHPDLAAQVYIGAYDLARQHKDYNSMGYACSYQGNLYESQDYIPNAIEKFRQAAGYFLQAGNHRSHACALRDLARQYAYMDSLPAAFAVLHKADSIVSTLNDDEVYSSILNAYGNLYMRNSDYEQAEDYFYRSLEIAKEALPDYIALCDLYLTMEDTEKAKVILEKIAEKDWEQAKVEEYYLHYIIGKQENHTDQALAYLELLMEVKDSLNMEKSNSKIAELEKRYVTVKLKNENTALQVRKQRYLIISIISSIIVLCLSFIYYAQKKKSEQKIIRQQAELNYLVRQQQALLHEIEEKRFMLENARKDIEETRKLQIEINLLTENYVKLERKLLTDSNLYRKLQQLIRQKKTTNGQVLVTDELWKQIVDEVTKVYPNLKSYILELCPDISESEWKYCCFYMLGFDGNEAAILLNINPGSIHTKNNRLRQKLHITLPHQTNLYEYLIMQLHKTNLT